MPGCSFSWWKPLGPVASYYRIKHCSSCWAIDIPTGQACIHTWLSQRCQLLVWSCVSTARMRLGGWRACCCMRFQKWLARPLYTGCDMLKAVHAWCVVGTAPMSLLGLVGGTASSSLSAGLPSGTHAWVPMLVWKQPFFSFFDAPAG